MEKIKKLIAKGKTSEALEYLINIEDAKNHQKEVLILNSRYNSLGSQTRKGILKNEEYIIEINKINDNLLDLIEKIERKDQVPIKQFFFKKIWIILPAIIIIIGIAFYFLNDKSVKEPVFAGFDSPDNFNILIFPFKPSVDLEVESSILVRLDQFKHDNSFDDFDIKKYTDTNHRMTYDSSREIGGKENAKFVLFGSTYNENDSINISLKYQSLIVDTIKSTSKDVNYNFQYVSEIEKGEITGNVEEAILKTIGVIEVNQYHDSLGLAIQNIDDKIENSPIKGFLYSLRGNLNIKAKNYTQSIADYEKAIESSPLDHIAYNNLGVLTMRHLEDKSKMLYYFEKAYELSGNKEFFLQNVELARKYNADSLTVTELLEVAPEIIEPREEVDRVQKEKVTSTTATNAIEAIVPDKLKIYYMSKESNESKDFLREIEKSGKLIKSVSWSKSNQYVIISGKNKYWYSDNIPEKLKNKLKEFQNAGVEIRQVALGHNDQYVILTKNGTSYGWSYSNIPDKLIKKFDELKKAKRNIRQVALGPNDQFVILEGKRGAYWSGNAPNELINKLKEFFTAGEEIRQVVLGPNDQFVILRGKSGAYWSGNAPDDLIKRLREMSDSRESVNFLNFNIKGEWIIILKR